jgi:hypothetical protein
MLTWSELKEIAQGVASNYCVRAKERIKILNFQFLPGRDWDTLKVSILFDGKPDTILIVL